MDKKEKIRKLYGKNGVYVGDETLNVILENSENTRKLIRIYEKEEMESMNYILGKSEDNKAFTKFELEAMNKIDLFDRQVVNISKLIWENRDNKEKLIHFQKILNESGCSECK